MLNNKASICIVTRNRVNILKKCLDAIWKLTEEPYELLIADNNSSDETREYLKSLKKSKKIDYLKLNKENVGYASAVNHLIYKSKKNLIITLDDDFIIKTKGWISRFQKIIEKVPQVGILGVNCEDQHFQIRYLNGVRLEVKSRLDKPFNIGGWCIVIPKLTFLELGYFNEEFAPYGIEDADYGLRVYLINKLNCYDPSVKGYHKCDMNSKEKKDSIVMCQSLMAYNMIGYISKKKRLYLGYHQKKIDIYNLKNIKRWALKRFEVDELIKKNSYEYIINHLKEEYGIVRNFFDEGDEKIAIIKLGYPCNNNCAICHEKRDKKYNHRFYELAKIKDKVDDCLKIGITRIILSGGEPCIHKDLLFILGYIQKSKIKCEIISNGRMFSYISFCKKIAEKNVDRVYVSLYGSKKEIHEDITKVHGSFSQTILGVKNLLLLKVNVRIRLIITKKNVDYISDSICFLKKMGIKEISLVNLEPKGYAIDNFKEYFVPLTKVALEIKKVLSSFKDVMIFAENLPICYLGPSYKEYYDVLQDRLFYIFRDDNISPKDIEDDDYYTYLSSCDYCLYKNKGCKGIFKNYLNLKDIDVFQIGV